MTANAKNRSAGKTRAGTGPWLSLLKKDRGPHSLAVVEARDDRIIS